MVGMSFGELIALLSLIVTVISLLGAFVTWVVRTLWKACKLLATITTTQESMLDRMENIEHRLTRLEGKHAG